jgi:hypothetical protein
VPDPSACHTGIQKGKCSRVDVGYELGIFWSRHRREARANIVDLFQFSRAGLRINLGKVFRVTSGREPTGTEIAAPGLSS